MSAVSFSGANGIDFNVILNAVMTQERTPLTFVEAQRKALQTQSGAFATLATKLAAMESAAEALNDSTAFGGRSVSTTDSTVLTATSDTDAIAGIYDVRVNELARSQVTASSSRHANTNQTIVATGGSLTVGGTVVTLSGSVTLQGLADAINVTDNIGVTATIVHASDGYQLVLTGKDTGLASAFTVSNQLTGATAAFTDTDSDGISGDSAADNSMLATDANVVINNVAITSATNTIEDAIPGTTLTLLRKQPDTPVTVSITESNDATSGLVKGFVDSYNALLTFAQQQNGSSGIARDPLLRSLRNELRSVLSATYAAGGSLESLGQVGIEFDRTGKLTINSTLLDEALKSNPTDLRDLFMGNGSDNGVFETMSSTVAQYTGAGALLSSARDRLDDQITTMDDRLAAMEARLELRRAALQKEYIAADMLISQLNSQGSSLTALSSSYSL